MHLPRALRFLRAPFQFVRAAWRVWNAASTTQQAIAFVAALGIAGMRSIHEMNAVKALLGVIINGVSLAEFVALGAIAWGPGLVMIIGGGLAVGGVMLSTGQARGTRSMGWTSQALATALLGVALLAALVNGGAPGGVAPGG